MAILLAVGVPSLAVSGEAIPPIELEDFESVLAHVKANLGGIAYVPADAVVEGVKVVDLGT